MADVDLNPIRAATVETRETSEFSSIRERIMSFAEQIRRRGRQLNVQAAQAVADP